MQYHPDRPSNRERKDWATEQFQNLNEAQESITRALLLMEGEIDIMGADVFDEDPEFAEEYKEAEKAEEEARKKAERDSRENAKREKAEKKRSSKKH